MVKAAVLLHTKSSIQVHLNLEMEVSTLLHINSAVVATPIVTPINQHLTLQPVQGLMELILLLNPILVLEIACPPGSHFVILILPSLDLSTILLMYLSLSYSTLSTLVLKFLSLEVSILVLIMDHPPAILVPVHALTLQLKTLEPVLALTHQLRTDSHLRSLTFLSSARQNNARWKSSPICI